MKKKNGLRNFFTLDVHNHEGFTLVELIVVIAIVAVFAGVAVPVYSGYIEKADTAADDQLVAAVNKAFAAACMVEGIDNYNADANDLVIGDTGEFGDITVEGVDTERFNNTFKSFYEGGKFKVYKKLTYNENKGMFEGRKLMSTFDRPGVLQGIEDAFNDISDLLLGYDDMSEAAIRDILLADFGEDLATVLGMEGMLDGYLAATKLEGEDLKAALEKYCPEYAALSDAEKAAWIANSDNAGKIAQLEANLGVMHFANAANTDADVKGSVDKIMAAVNQVNEGNLASPEEMLAYYLSTPRGQKALANNGNDSNNPNVQSDFNNFLTTTSSMHGMNGYELASISKALGSDVQNEAGINTLGALYALSAGYYNSDYYSGGEHGEIGYFTTVANAIKDPNFQTYYEKQAGTDIDAYLEQMRNLSNSENLDLTQSDVFTGVFTGGSN